VRRHRRLTAAAVLAVVAVAALIAGYRLYATPTTDPVSAAAPADAILALGGDVRVAWDAYRLAEQGVAKTVVLSNPYRPETLADLCAHPPGSVPVTCFVPDPATTRGEAEELRRLVAKNGWDDVIVMTPRFHVSRARMIVRRCYQGRLAMVAAPRQYSALTWIYQFGYQTAGYAKAYLVDRGC
jgi:hypothetical protein